MKIYISGFGTVARRFVQLIYEKQAIYKKRYGVEMTVVGVIGREGLLENNGGLPIKKLLASPTLAEFAQTTGETFNQDITFQGDVLVECTPTSENNGEPGYTYMKKAIDAGMDVVAISKGALVYHFHELMDKASAKGVRIKYSGATAAALPTLDIGEYSLAGTEIFGFEGVLNGTSNFILSEMQERGISFKEALADAKAQGIAETNPTLDVSGVDSANKIVLLANGLLQARARRENVNIEGIEQLSTAFIEEAKTNNQVVKLIASAKQTKAGQKLEVIPKAISIDHPLAAVKGTNKALTFETKEMGQVTVSGGASSPLGAASAAMKDVLNLRM